MDDRRKEKISPNNLDTSSAIETAYEEVFQEPVQNDVAIFYNPDFDLVQEVKDLVPDQIESDEIQGIDVHKFEVVIAYNLQPPYRFSQEYFWLEVLADSESGAMQAALEWIQTAEPGFEITPMIRRAAPHDLQLGLGKDRKPLRISWSLPVVESIEVGSMIRHPITGTRIGFVAYPEDEDRWLLPEGKEFYRLIVRKPARGADPVVLAPIVKDLGVI